MLVHNQAKKRCLVLSRNKNILLLVNSVLSELDYQIDNIFVQKAAMSCFLQYKHHFIIVEDSFLPRYPYRLLLFFKIAHRMPGIIIFNERGKDLTGFSYLIDTASIILTPPFQKETFKESIITVNKTLSRQIKHSFKKDILIQVGILLPLVIYILFKLFDKF